VGERTLVMDHAWGRHR